MPSLRIKFEVPETLLDADRVRSELALEVKKATFQVETTMKESMTGPKHGRFYRVGRITRAIGASGKLFKGSRTYLTKKGNRREIVGAKVHQASAPGEAPAIRSANLLNSIQSRFENTGLTGIVGVGAGYGGILELRKNRPFAAPALRQVEPLFLAGVRTVAERMLNP